MIVVMPPRLNLILMEVLYHTPANLIANCKNFMHLFKLIIIFNLTGSSLSAILSLTNNSGGYSDAVKVMS